MEADEVDAAIDALYGLLPDEFTAARDALAKRVRDSDKARAGEVKALRKPTVAAWAVNQAVRSHGTLVGDLDAAAADARRAQQALLSGRGSAGVRDATARRRQVVAALTEVALGSISAAGRPVTDGVRDAIGATFDAAALDDDARAVLRSGRLAKELEAAAGFGDVGGFTLLAGGDDPTATAGTDADARRSSEGDADDQAAAAAAVRAAEVERLTSVVDRAERAAVRAARDAERATAEVERIVADLERARARAAAAEEAAADTAGEAAAARQALTEIQSEDGPGS